MRGIDLRMQGQNEDTTQARIVGTMCTVERGIVEREKGGVGVSTSE